MKQIKSFRLSEEIIRTIEELSKKTGKTQGQIIEEAVKLLKENKQEIQNQIELYQKENEQLRLALSMFQEKQKAIEKVEETYKLLLNEKDKRIEELKEQLNRQSKPFWKFWK